MGPAALESNITPDLLKEAGRHHPLGPACRRSAASGRTPGRPAAFGPVSNGVDERRRARCIATYWREFADMIVYQFEELLEQSERQPLVFALSLHGFIAGQRFRLRPVRQAIRHCVGAQAQGPRNRVHACGRYRADTASGRPGLIRQLNCYREVSRHDRRCCCGCRLQRDHSGRKPIRRRCTGVISTALFLPC